MTIALILITALAAAWLLRQWWRAELDPPERRAAPLSLERRREIDAASSAHIDRRAA